MSQQEDEKAEPWRKRWQAGITPWDQMTYHESLPRLMSLVSEFGFCEGSYILEPGCGTAHNGAYLASLGYEVVSADFVAEAVKSATSLYADKAGLTIVKMDIFAEVGHEERKYDAIFDRAMLCALQPSNRLKYIEALTKRLKPGGFFFGILFRPHSVDSEGPPFPISELDLVELMQEYFSLVTIEPVKTMKPAPLGLGEYICIWQKL